MRGVRLGFQHRFPPLVIELLNQFRVTAPGIGRRDILHVVPLPQSIAVPEGF